MARSLRVTQPQNVYHLISRFVASDWFMRGDTERRAYLQLLGLGLKKSDWRCLAFALMSNHIHLAMYSGREPLAAWMREAHAAFAEWINERHERIGAVFVRGPNELLVRPDGVANVLGYIHRNPLRAGVVSDPRESDWTSHRAYLGLAERPSWLDTEKGLELAGFDDAEQMDKWVRATDIDRAAAKAAVFAPRVGRPRAQRIIDVTPTDDALGDLSVPATSSF